ncbi:hypothetical protein JT358_02660 [Micrococcales bacterium 31B]|nr:hypothetical protein [Micrococcales bacterium 31B]
MNPLDSARDLLACATGNAAECTLIAAPNGGFWVALAMSTLLMLFVGVALTMLNLLLVDFFVVRVRVWKYLPWLIAIPSLVLQLCVWLTFSVPYFTDIENYFVWLLLTPLFALLPAGALVVLFTLLCHVVSNLIAAGRQVAGADGSAEPSEKFRRLYLSVWVTAPTLALLVAWAWLLGQHPELKTDPFTFGPDWLQYGVNLWPVELGVNLVWTLTIWLGSLPGLVTFGVFALIAAALQFGLRRPGASLGLTMLDALCRFVCGLAIGTVVIFALGTGVIAAAYVLYGWIGAGIALFVVFCVAMITMLRRTELAGDEAFESSY